MGNKSKKETSNEVLRFIRLKNGYGDLIGYVETFDGYIKIRQPLRIEIETIFEENRQILSLQEYLPQSVIDIKEIKFMVSEIMFCAPVREEFYEQYEYVADFFYNNNSKIKQPVKKQTEPVEETAEKINKVVSILEAMASKKDKPVH